MYRPIEILLGATRYGYSVDMWSAGCILGELVLGKTLMAGKLEMEQLNLIFDLLGTPTPNDGLNDLPLLRTGKVKIEKPKPSRLREKYMKKISLPCLNLLEKLLELDPAKRLTARRALESRYFKAEPRAPDYPEQLGPLQLGNGDCDVHEFRTKKKRKEVKSIAGAARDEARESGMTEEAAEAIFREVYDEQMLRVKEEGNSALKTKEEREKEEEKRKRDEEKRIRDAAKALEDERAKSRRETGSENEHRISRDKRRHIDGEDQRDCEEQSRKRRKRDDDEIRKSYRRSDRDNKRRDASSKKEDRRRSEDDRSSERWSNELRIERKRSYDSHRDDDKSEDDLRPKNEHFMASDEIAKFEGRFDRVAKEFLDVSNSETPIALDTDKMKGRDDDYQIRESKRSRERSDRSREHKKSSRRDRDKHHKRGGHRDRDRYSANDRDRDRGRDEYPRNSAQGITAGRDYSEGHRDDYYRRGLDHHGPGDHWHPPPIQGGSRGPPLDHSGPPKPEHRHDRGPPHVDRDSRGPPDHRKDRVPPSPDWESRGLSDHRGDRHPLPPDRDSRGPPIKERSSRGLPLPVDRDSQGPPTNRIRGPPLSDRDSGGPNDHRNGRGTAQSDRVSWGPPDYWSDRGPLSHDRDSRGTHDRNGRGPLDIWNDRGPPPSERDSRVQTSLDQRIERGPPTGDRRGPSTDIQCGTGIRGPSSGQDFRGGPPHRDDRPPPREERRYSPPRSHRS